MDAPHGASFFFPADATHLFCKITSWARFDALVQIRAAGQAQGTAPTPSRFIFSLTPKYSSIRIRVVYSNADYTHSRGKTKSRALTRHPFSLPAQHLHLSASLAHRDSCRRVTGDDAVGKPRGGGTGIPQFRQRVHVHAPKCRGGWSGRQGSADTARSSCG